MGNSILKAGAKERGSGRAPVKKRRSGAPMATSILKGREGQGACVLKKQGSSNGDLDLEPESRHQDGGQVIRWISTKEETQMNENECSG